MVKCGEDGRLQQGDKALSKPTLEYLKSAAAAAAKQTVAAAWAMQEQELLMVQATPTMAAEQSGTVYRAGGRRAKGAGDEYAEGAARAGCRQITAQGKRKSSAPMLRWAFNLQR